MKAAAEAEKKEAEHQIQKVDDYRCFHCDGVPSSKGSERALRLKKLLNKEMIGTWQTCKFALDGGGGCDRFVCDDQDCITWLDGRHERACSFDVKNGAKLKKPKKK